MPVTGMAETRRNRSEGGLRQGFRPGNANAPPPTDAPMYSVERRQAQAGETQAAAYRTLALSIRPVRPKLGVTLGGPLRLFPVCVGHPNLQRPAG